jgi:superfamily I DNA/RNA helicase
MEWDHVYIIGARQGMMPHKDGEINEEHRIFYVAASRAAKTLDISFAGNNSEFLNEFVDQIEES